MDNPKPDRERRVRVPAVGLVLLRQSQERSTPWRVATYRGSPLAP